MAPVSDLQHVMTMNLNRRLHECTHTLNDGRLLAKLGAGDPIAQELKYHLVCLTGLYNRERSHLRNLEKEQCHSEEPDVYPLVLSELVNYIIETSLSSGSPATFPIAGISQLYQQRLEQLGITSPTVNTRRLKDKLLAEISGI